MRQNRSPLNVGLVFDDSLDRPDGVAQYVKTLGEWLSGQGHQVSYLVGETKIQQWAGGKVYSLSKNRTVKFNGNKVSIPLPGSRRKIKTFMDGHDFDVIHVMAPYSPFMGEKIIKYAPDHTVIVGTFHTFPAGKTSVWGSKLLRLVLNRSLKKFDRFISVSSAQADFVRTIYRINSSVIPNPISTKKFEHKLKSTGTHNKIVFLGRLVKRKGAAQLIDAFILLNQQNKEARLVIAGDGEQRKELEAKVINHGLSDKVKFLGFIDEADKPKILSSAAVACFPSLYGEAFGIVLIEAMAAGSGPIIAGDNPGYHSVLSDRPELLVNPKNTKEFAAKLNAFLTDAKLANDIQNWQKNEVHKYDIDVVGAQVISIYESAIARLGKKRNNKTHE
jgi:phosphatidylinositol alpha-mannosyltransferase